MAGSPGRHRDSASGLATCAHRKLSDPGDRAHLLLRVGTVSLAVLVVGLLLAVLLAALLLAAILRRLSWIVAVALLLAVRAVTAVIIVATHDRSRRV